MSKFHGKYFRVEEEIRQLPDGRIELRVNPTGETYGQGAIRFDLNTGQSEIEWFNKNGTSASSSGTSAPQSVVVEEKPPARSFCTDSTISLSSPARAPPALRRRRLCPSI